MANIHLTSNQKRREKGNISILAIVETIFFVFLTWFVAYKYNYYFHIITSIAIAPLLLLKTRFSIDTALNLFFYKPKILKNGSLKIIPIITIIILSIILSCIMNYFLINIFVLHTTGWELFLKSIAISIIIVSSIPITVVGNPYQGFESSISAYVAGLITITGAIFIIGFGLMTNETTGILITIFNSINMIVGIIIGSRIGIFFISLMDDDTDNTTEIIMNRDALVASTGTGLILGLGGGLIGILMGYLFRSLLIKTMITIYSSFRHPIKTINSISLNFREQIIVNDIFYTPELLPEISKNGNTFHLAGLFKDFWRIPILAQITVLFITPFWLSTYLYRWSIKSTAWFYFPLVYLANLNILTNKEKKEITITRQSWQLILGFNTFISVLLLIYFDIASVEVKEKFSYIPIVLDFTNKIPFTIVPNSIWLVVISIILYLISYIFVSAQTHHKKETKKIVYTEFTSFIYWIIRLKFILWYIFFLWNIIYISNEHLIPKIIAYLN